MNKLVQNHHATPEEVEEVFFDDLPHFKKYRDIYHAYGQTVPGRYLFAVFRLLGSDKAKLITAYEMSEKQRRYYQRVKGAG
ncbi:BrnT family toxin [Candidatus Acetothermia bacterium]|nr:BrnT family toxin [Candidatus Acetothermia bacterium]MBI3660883.1 BrnT family toxin [Candidatus Acetothermia bacterium]